MKRPRTADPYRDLDVIDARAPRFNQAVIGGLALVAVVTGGGGGIGQGVALGLARFGAHVSVLDVVPER